MSEQAAQRVIDEIYETRSTRAADGRVVRLHSEISPEEGRFLRRCLESLPQVEKTLEVGCAYGLSSLAICSALTERAGAHHFIIDPFQKTEWAGAGINALKRAGLDNYRLIEERSEVVLPSLLAEHENSFDFIFIDGWHTFDHTLVDCFYALRLLKTDGILVVDDCDWPAVAKAIAYLSRYPNIKLVEKIICYPAHPVWNSLSRIFSKLPVRSDWFVYFPLPIRRLIRRPNMIALKKTGDDTRNWDWYRPF